MKRLIIAYRDNVLYAKYIPMVLEALKSQGWDYDLLVIPRGEPADAAAAQAYSFLEHQQLGGNYVADHTCRWDEVTTAAWENADRLGIRPTQTLDKIFALIVNDQLKVTTFESGFKKLLLMHCQDREIKTIYIVLANIYDHIDEGECSDSSELRNEASMAMGDDRDARCLYIADEFAGYIYDVLSDVEVVKCATYQDAINVSSNDGKALLIVDRHAEGLPWRKYGERFPESLDRVYLLPLSDAAEKLAEEERLELSFSPDEIAEKLSETD